jgi:predicted alpha/beta-fold hydrolase
VQRGHPVLRFNLRGAGPSRPYCRLQYHAGSTGDLHAALGQLDPALLARGLLAVGFSLGGNLLLKYLAEYGERGTPVTAAATVSAPIDLAAASRCLTRWRNRLYQRYLLGSVKRNCTTAMAELTAGERAAILAAPSVYAFDHGFTAPRNGYADADGFYEANAAKRFLDGVRTPTLLIHAEDDPFVPAAPYHTVEWRRLSRLTPLLPRSGGHLGFHDPSGFWLLERIRAFFEGRAA